MSRDSLGQGGGEGHLSYCGGKMVGKAPPIAASRKDVPYHQLGCSFPYSHPPPPFILTSWLYYYHWRFTGIPTFCWRGFKKCNLEE